MSESNDWWSDELDDVAESGREPLDDFVSVPEAPAPWRRRAIAIGALLLVGLVGMWLVGHHKSTNGTALDVAGAQSSSTIVEMPTLTTSDPTAAPVDPSSTSATPDSPSVPTPALASDTQPPGTTPPVTMLAENKSPAATPTGPTGAAPPLPNTTGTDLDQVTRELFRYKYWLEQNPSSGLLDKLYEPGSPASNHFAEDLQMLASGQAKDDQPAASVLGVKVVSAESSLATVTARTQYGTTDKLLETLVLARGAGGRWLIRDYVVHSAA